MGDEKNEKSLKDGRKNAKQKQINKFGKRREYGGGGAFDL
jgi:hypothetical protein